MIVIEPEETDINIISNAQKMLETAGFSANITRKLGRGENGITFETSDNKALKIVRYGNEAQRKQLVNEITFQKELAALGIAPFVHDDSIVSKFAFILMDKVIPVHLDMVSNTQSDSYSESDSFTKKLIRLIAKMIYHGYLHNDIHWGNVAATVHSPHEPILIDFGFTTHLGYTPDKLCFNQILMAQLYALTDACNVNNRINDSIDDIILLCDNEAIDTIYELRQGKSSIYNSLVPPRRTGRKTKLIRETFTRKKRNGPLNRRKKFKTLKRRGKQKKR